MCKIHLVTGVHPKDCRRSRHSWVQLKTEVFGANTSAELGGYHAQSSALRVQQSPQVEVEEYDYQNYKYHSALKHVRVQLVILDLLVSIGVAQALRLVVHDLVDLHI